MIQKTLSENPNGYDLSLAEYAEEIYSDSEIENIPERRSSILSAPPVVFFDQQRNEQQLILDALRGATNPQNIDRIATQVFDREFEDNIGEAVGEKAPRFRGVYSVVGTNDGKINGDQMNMNDYVYYAGTSPAWQATYIYQWTGAGWEIRAKPSSGNTAYGWMYLNAVNSIAQNAPTGIFSDVFCQALTATSAFFQNLFTRYINIYSGGRISTENFTNRDGVTGFMLDGLTGLIESNNMRTKGMNAIDMTATRGTFDDIVVRGNSSFIGKIKPSNGIMVTNYWGAFADRTEGQWYNVFASLVPNIGDRISVFGGATAKENQDTNTFHKGIVVFIERTSSSVIQLNLYPTDNFDRFILCNCTTGSSTVATHQHYVAW